MLRSAGILSLSLAFAAAPALTAQTAAPDPPRDAACPSNAKRANLNFTLKDVANRNIRLADYRGKVILLDFWATWCAPCKTEIPWFVEFQDKYGKDGLQVIGISVDDTREKLLPYVRDMRMNYTVLQGRGNERILDAYGPVVGIPVTVLISREGLTCAKFEGTKTKEAVERGIVALLASKEPHARASAKR